jgi:hypothetical protein
MIGTQHNWTRNEDVLMCVYMNDLGEQCWRTSRIAKGETEEQAKERIMAVSMFHDPYAEQDAIDSMCETDDEREAAIDAALGEKQ